MSVDSMALYLFGLLLLIVGGWVLGGVNIRARLYEVDRVDAWGFLRGVAILLLITSGAYLVHFGAVAH